MQLILGNCLTTLRTLPVQSVQTCVTSPPYWRLRDYGVDSQLGLDHSPEYLKLAEVRFSAEGGSDGCPHQAALSTCREEIAA